MNGEELKAFEEAVDQLFQDMREDYLRCAHTLGIDPDPDLFVRRHGQA